MNRTPVSSSNLKAVGYDATEQILEIEFLNGSAYQYFNVPQAMYLGMMRAGSRGGFLDKYVKKGGYRYRRVY